MPRKVERTRNGNTWTEAQFWAEVRSAFRQKFRYWKPAQTAKIRARRDYRGGGRRKYEYKCSGCKHYYPEKEINIDHIIPVGSLKRPKDLAGFLERLTPEDPDAYQVLCSECHKNKTKKDVEKMRRNK